MNKNVKVQEVVVFWSDISDMWNVPYSRVDIYYYIIYLLQLLKFIYITVHNHLKSTFILPT